MILPRFYERNGLALTSPRPTEPHRHLRPGGHRQGGAGDRLNELADTPSLAYNPTVWFVETPVFSSQLYGLLSDDGYRALQLALALRPEQGVLIPGSGGLRKLRWTHRGKGKRGGLRVIYYWDVAEDAIYLLFLYPKNQQEDLTPDQLRRLKRIVEEDLK